MSVKSKLNKFKKTQYSADKEFLNAIITSNVNYVPKKKKHIAAFKTMILIYAAIIFIVVSASITMLALSNAFVKSNKALITIIESIVFIVITLDVGFRWYTSEVRIKKGNLSYFLFPFTISGLILIISILPSLYLINIWTGENFKIFNNFENMKFLRIFRIILLANLVPGIQIFSRVLRKEKSTLYVVFSIVIITIILFALVIYNIEQGIDDSGHRPGDKNYDPQNVQFRSFWDALYFSAITLTTIGFGDKTPHTNMGKIITIIMSIIGIAVLATPSGVIAGGFISEIKESKRKKHILKR